MRPSHWLGSDRSRWSCFVGLIVGRASRLDPVEGTEFDLAELILGGT